MDLYEEGNKGHIVHNDTNNISINKYFHRRMERSGVNWSFGLCPLNIANRNRPVSSCRAALTTTRCSWTRKISARPTSWPRRLRRLCRRPTTRRTPFAKSAQRPICSTASVLTSFTSGPLSNPRAITVSLLFFLFLPLSPPIFDGVSFYFYVVHHFGPNERGNVGNYEPRKIVNGIRNETLSCFRSFLVHPSNKPWAHLGDRSSFIYYDFFFYFGLLGDFQGTVKGFREWGKKKKKNKKRKWAIDKRHMEPAPMLITNTHTHAKKKRREEKKIFPIRSVSAHSR